MKTRKFSRLCAWCAALTLISTAVSLKATVWIVVNPADSGPGTLRNAVASSAAGDTVQFAIKGIIGLVSSINIPHALTIQGPGPSQLTIDAGGVDRAFLVTGGPIFLSGMTIQNGLALGPNGADATMPGQNGGNGADAYGGAIYDPSSSVTLIVSNCWFNGNIAMAGRGGKGGGNPVGAGFTPGNGGTGGAASGGAIDVYDVITLNSTFSNNHAINGQGGDGGSNANTAYFVAGGTGGTAGYGGGGGAVLAEEIGATNCTFSGNTVVVGTGGQGGNSALGGGGTDGNGGFTGGGAIETVHPDFFFSCTIVSNSAFAGAGGLGGSGSPPGASGTPGTGTGGGLYGYLIVCANQIGNTILADNFASTTCSNYYIDLEDDGYNFIGSQDIGCLFGSSSIAGTIASPIHPQLGPLAQNGGGLPTHATTLTSPVTDQGYSFGLTTDERGAPRPYVLGLSEPSGGDGSDIGAFELGSSGLGMSKTSNNIVLSWPAYYGDFALQFVTRLQGSNNWNYLSATPVQVGSQLVVTNPMTNAIVFFRLISQ